MRTRLPLLHLQSDERLAELTRLGDRRAFEVLIGRHRAGLLAHCRRIVPGDEAEDALQQGLLGAWLALQRGAEVRNPRAWLHRTVRNAALRAVEAAKSERELPDAATEPGTDELLSRRLELRDALAALAHLPELQREALLETAFRGHSYEQAADLLGCTESTLRGVLQRARATLRTAVAGLVPGPLLARIGRRLPATGRGGGAASATGGAAALALKAGAVVAGAGALAAGAGLVTHGQGAHGGTHGTAIHASALPASGRAGTRPAPSAAARHPGSRGRRDRPRAAVSSPAVPAVRTVAAPALPQRRQLPQTARPSSPALPARLTTAPASTATATRVPTARTVTRPPATVTPPVTVQPVATVVQAGAAAGAGASPSDTPTTPGADLTGDHSGGDVTGGTGDPTGTGSSDPASVDSAH